jgi:hypothetical protein
MEAALSKPSKFSSGTPVESAQEFCRDGCHIDERKGEKHTLLNV